MPPYSECTQDDKKNYDFISEPAKGDNNESIRYQQMGRPQ
jgi:hypothetical protein